LWMKRWEARKRSSKARREECQMVETWCSLDNQLIVF
jgi:hypothetical protein